MVKEKGDFATARLQTESENADEGNNGGDSWKALLHVISTTMTTGAMLNILIVGGEILEVDESICLGIGVALIPIIVYINYKKYKAATATTTSPTTDGIKREAYAHLQDKQSDDSADQDDGEFKAPTGLPRTPTRRPSQDPVSVVSPVMFNPPASPSFEESLLMSNNVGSDKAASLARIVSAVPPICELNAAKDKEIETLNTRLTQLHSELTASKLEQERLSKQNERMLEQLGSKSPPRQDTKLVLESKNNELISLRAENSNLKKEKDTLTEQVTELKEVISQQEKAAEEEKEAQEEAISLTDEDSLQRRLHDATRRNSELKKTIEDLQGLLRAAKAGAKEGGAECGELVGWKRREEEIRRAHLNLIIREQDLLSGIIEKLVSKRISSLTLTNLNTEEASVLSAVFKAKAQQATTLLQSLTFASHCSDSLTVLMSEAPFPMDAESAAILGFISKQLSEILKSAADLPKTFESAVEALPVTASSEFFAP